MPKDRLSLTSRNCVFGKCCHKILMLNSNKCQRVMPIGNTAGYVLTGSTPTAAIFYAILRYRQTK